MSKMESIRSHEIIEAAKYCELDLFPFSPIGLFDQIHISSLRKSRSGIELMHYFFQLELSMYKMHVFMWKR